MLVDVVAKVATAVNSAAVIRAAVKITAVNTAAVKGLSVCYH